MTKTQIQRKWFGLGFVLLSCLGFLPAPAAHGDAISNSACRACDREMRKVFESLQAWRRSHAGGYPGGIADLKSSGILSHSGGICPDVLKELGGADPSHRQLSSRGEGRDPVGTFEYEMSSKVAKSRSDEPFLPAYSRSYTRQDLKSELLRRQFYEQVAILRCGSHRGIAPSTYAGQNDVRRNLTVEGKVYWSGIYWEENWLSDVPYCCRDANVLFGLKGPPFHTDHSPSLDTALDLRKWNTAFGDHPWWWTYPMFEADKKRQTAAHLRPFFEERHGREVQVGARSWWIDGLVQLQGMIVSGDYSYVAPTRQTFVWERTNLTVARLFREASWLQGTVWTAEAGESAGWLLWHYSDGSTERVPLVYGKTTARFWGDLKQIEGEKGFPEPVWKHHETAEAVGKERWLRLYQQTWINPRPDVMVVSLDFVSNRDCPASPFLIAVNVTP